MIEIPRYIADYYSDKLDDILVAKKDIFVGYIHHCDKSKDEYIEKDSLVFIKRENLMDDYDYIEIHAATAKNVPCGCLALYSMSCFDDFRRLTTEEKNHIKNLTTQYKQDEIDRLEKDIEQMKERLANLKKCFYQNNLPYY